MQCAYIKANYIKVAKNLRDCVIMIACARNMATLFARFVNALLQATEILISRHLMDCIITIWDCARTICS